jgi:hypothetical protein
MYQDGKVSNIIVALHELANTEEGKLIVFN